VSGAPRRQVNSGRHGDVTVLTFAPSVSRPGSPAPDDFAVVVLGSTVLLAPSPDHGFTLPTVATAGELETPIALGAMNGRSVWLLRAVSIPDGLRRLGWIDVVTSAPPAVVAAAARGLLVADFHTHRRLCGGCGSPTEVVPGMVARRCSACGRFEYAKAQPVALVAIWRPGRSGRNEVLLGRHTYGATEGMWALTGGYVDPGERLEDAAVREAYEETGLVVSDVRYYSSEGWGMSGPSVLLTGFLGRAVDPLADPVVDGREIAEARFFPVDELPAKLPPLPFLAARLLADLPALLS